MDDLTLMLKWALSGSLCAGKRIPFGAHLVLYKTLY